MASGGSSGRSASGSRSFGFGSDDVLCSYDDYTYQDPSNARRSDPSAKEFHESRMGRPLVNVYDQQEDYPKEDVISAVEKCMKKYADNLLRFLEGISGRLSQLELHCYKLERSVGEFRSDMVRDQNESDMKLTSLEKHLQEVHRSVQILRDKQELAETQKELSKLQTVQKEPTTPSHLQKNEEGVAPSISELQKHRDTPHTSQNQQLALVPHQTTAPPPLPARASDQSQPYNQLPVQQPVPASCNTPQDPYLLSQAATYYAQPLPRGPQSQPEVLYGQPRPEIQDQAPALQQQTPFPQYQQQWPQPPPQLVQPQQPTPQAQIRPQTPPTYPLNPHQQPNDPYSAIPQPGGNHAEAVSYGYGGPGSTAPQPPSHHNMQRQPQPQGSQGSPGPPLNKGGYLGTAVYPPQPNVQGYNAMYSIDGSRGVHSQNIQQGSYPPSNVPAQNQQVGLHHPGSQMMHPGSQMMHPGSQMMRNNPYGEMIERAVSMGYAREQVVGVIHRMGESGQPVDFNALLDRLDPRASGPTPRGWSS